MVIITDSKSSDFYFERISHEYTSPKIKYYTIEFHIDSINEDTCYIYCTLLIPSNPTDKNIIIHLCHSYHLITHFFNEYTV